MLKDTQKVYLFWVLLLIPLALTILIPTKKEMYIIALTKNLSPFEIYSMSKEELIDGIDYLFDKVKEIEDDGMKD